MIEFDFFILFLFLVLGAKEREVRGGSNSFGISTPCVCCCWSFMSYSMRVSSLGVSLRATQNSILL